MKKCSSCKLPVDQWPIKPYSSLTKTCSVSCALDDIEKQKDKQFKKETRTMKAKLNDNDSSYWSDKAQKMFNKYIMARDAGRPCISCVATKVGIDYCAGHYVPRGRSAALRFNEFNTNRQCNHNCNLRLSGNLIEYRKAIILRYGEEKVLWLEGNHEMPRYRIEDYKRIHEEYKMKIKQLKSIGGGSGD